MLPNTPEKQFEYRQQADKIRKLLQSILNLKPRRGANTKDCYISTKVGKRTSSLGLTFNRPDHLQKATNLLRDVHKFTVIVNHASNYLEIPLKIKAEALVEETNKKFETDSHLKRLEHLIEKWEKSIMNPKYSGLSKDELATRLWNKLDELKFLMVDNSHQPTIDKEGKLQLNTMSREDFLVMVVNDVLC